MTTYLYFCLEHEMGIARVCEAKNAPELIHSEIANVPNLKFWGLTENERSTVN
jgi:hypothetical protein